MAQTKRIPTSEEDRPLIRKKPNLERQADIEKNLIAFKRNETRVKALASTLTFDLLCEFEGGSTDIGKVNRMIAAASPVNRKYLILFFGHHLPWKYSKDGGNFTRKISGEKKVKAKQESISAFIAECLANPEYDFWAWIASNTENPAMKAKPFNERITTLVERAMHPTKQDLEKGLAPLSAKDILEAVLAVKDLTANELASLISAGPAVNSVNENDVDEGEKVSA